MNAPGSEPRFVLIVRRIGIVLTVLTAVGAVALIVAHEWVMGILCAVMAAVNLVQYGLRRRRRDSRAKP